MWLIELNDDSNVKNKMTDAQMEFTAMRIYETYSLKVTDLTLFFRNIKEGVYGQFYENLSREKIMEWLAEYFKIRCEYGEMQSQCNHENFSILKDKINKDLIDKMFEGIGEEKINHDNKENRLGTRINKTITINLITKIKSETTEFLKNYLIKNSYGSKTYDETIYNLIETELDIRNNNENIPPINT